jgi:hypothetical protein
MPMPLVTTINVASSGKRIILYRYLIICLFWRIYTLV